MNIQENTNVQQQVEQSIPPITPPVKKKKRWPIVVAAICAVVIALGIIGALIGDDDNSIQVVESDSASGYSFTISITQFLSKYNSLVDEHVKDDGVGEDALQATKDFLKINKDKLTNDIDSSSGDKKYVYKNVRQDNGQTNFLLTIGVDSEDRVYWTEFTFRENIDESTGETLFSICYWLNQAIEQSKSIDDIRVNWVSTINKGVTQTSDIKYVYRLDNGQCRLNVMALKES